MEEHLGRMNASVARLGEASRRLTVSQARLGVQLPGGARGPRDGAPAARVSCRAPDGALFTLSTV